MPRGDGYIESTQASPPFRVLESTLGETYGDQRRGSTLGCVPLWAGPPEMILTLPPPLVGPAEEDIQIACFTGPREGFRAGRSTAVAQLLPESSSVAGDAGPERPSHPDAPVFRQSRYRRISTWGIHPT